MTTYKPMDLIKFTRLVKAEGYKIVSTTKHHAIVTLNDERVMIFAIYHSSSSKKYVKAEYVKRFYKIIHRK